MPKYRTDCCNEVLESKHRHDFQACKCGRSFVDGGDDYMRLGFQDCEPPKLIKDKPESGGEKRTVIRGR